MRRIIILAAIPVAALWWLCCVAVYLTALSGRDEMVESLFLTLLFGSMAVGFLAGQALRLAGAAKLPPRPLIAVFCFAGFLCVVLQGVVNWRLHGGDLSGGVASGDPGDRYLNSHGTRIRALTEEEYQWAKAARRKQVTALLVTFSSIVLGMTLHALMVWRTHQAGAEPHLPQSDLLADHAPV